jgi:hypothetical protein
MYKIRIRTSEDRSLLSGAPPVWSEYRVETFTDVQDVLRSFEGYNLQECIINKEKSYGKKK